MITSSANERIKDIRKLREKRQRQESGLFYCEGLHIVGELLDLGWEVEHLIYSADLLCSDYGKQLLKRGNTRNLPILEVSADVFMSLSAKDGPQGIAAVARQKWLPIESISLEEHPFWIALDAVADPGNLGTILRTSDSAGFGGVILLDQSTDPYDPACMRASMGALFSQKIVQADFASFAAWKNKCQVALVGSSGAASMDYHVYRYPIPIVLLMGSERQGLLEHHLQLCDQVVKIPMVGHSDSLNLAVATAVIVYEIFNQRREKHPGG